MQKDERESKRQKEKDDKKKAEEMRDAAMVGLGSKLKVNSLYRTDYFMSHRKFIIKQGSLKKIIKLSNFKIQQKWQRFQACACLHSF